MQPQPRILIADDDESLRRPLAELLRREGCSCVAVENAFEAIAALEKDRFDLLISDIDMPGNANLELIRRAPQIAAGMPIILLTGYPTVQTAVAAVELSIVAYLTKPLAFDLLWKHVQSVIHRHRRYESILAQRERLVAWTQELDEIAQQMKHASEKSEDALIDSYTAVSIRSALESLTDLQSFTERLKSEKDRASAPPSDTLISALQQTISVLEQTKHNFKSKRLGDLRQHLEAVLTKTKG